MMEKDIFIQTTVPNEGNNDGKNFLIYYCCNQIPFERKIHSAKSVVEKVLFNSNTQGLPLGKTIIKNLLNYN